MVQVLERLVIISCKLCLPNVGTVVAYRGYTIVLQTCGGVRGRIVVFLRVREVGTQVGFQLQMVDDFPFGVGIGNDAGIAGRRLDVVQVGDGIANHRLAIANKDVLTDRRGRIVIRAIGIVDGLCRWGDQSRHPTVGCPLGRLTRVAMVHITQSTQVAIGTRGIDSHQQTL